MSWWQSLFAEFWDDWTLLVVLALVVVLPVHARAAPDQRRRRTGLIAMVSLHLISALVASVFRAEGGETYRDSHTLALVFAVSAGVFMVGAIVFAVVAPRLHVRIPQIMQDVVLAGVAGIFALGFLSRAGFNIQGLLATSAVLTVVIGFALQDTLGNLFAGLALQLDDSVAIGDWIKLQDISGRVTEMRWRYTAIETRNWETLIVPNAVLTKERVLILGRRSGEPQLWRRWVYFNVDFRFQPSDVIEAVDIALKSAPIENMNPKPEPHCVLMDLGESYCRYAVRYWLKDISRDDGTDSVVRTRIYFALKRVGIPLSIPAHAVFMTEESEGRKAQKLKADDDRRFEIISKVDLFQKLSDDDKRRLAGSLRYAPFTKGEVMTRQGAEAHWLYIIIEGEASVRVRGVSGKEREVARLSYGSIFGEMSLLTGEPRAATVVALSDVECYRLEKAAFQTIIRERPDVAEHIASILAKRQQQLTLAREDSGGTTIPPANPDGVTRDLVGKIRRFFGLNDVS